MKKLYHGTSSKYLKAIERFGLRPRGKRRKGNWDSTFPSHPDAVYLTTAYAVHFAQCAVSDTTREQLLILEVEPTYLRFEKFAPDEDFLEQVTRRTPEWKDLWERYPGLEGRIPRTKYFRKRLLTEFQHHWLDSVEALGNCSYFGTIPFAAVTRYALLPAKGPLSWMSDPTISTTNYAIMGHFYRSLISYIFDGVVEPTSSSEVFASFRDADLTRL